MVSTKILSVVFAPWISWHIAFLINMPEKHIHWCHFFIFILGEETTVCTNATLDDINNLKQWISVNCSKIVLVAIRDEGSRFVSPAFNALKRLGARDPILSSFRASFAFVGYAETNKPSWVTQEQKKRYEGPSIISLIIPLQSRQTSKKYITILDRHVVE